MCLSDWEGERRLINNLVIMGANFLRRFRNFVNISILINKCIFLSIRCSEKKVINYKITDIFINISLQRIRGGIPKKVS